MILADANIWIDFFRGRKPEVRKLMEANQLVMHAHVVAELALGSLQDRALVLYKLDSMPQVHVVPLSHVRRMIEARSLFSKGVGLTDSHLLAACLTNSGTLLWTSDRRLGEVADSMRVRAHLA